MTKISSNFSNVLNLDRVGGIGKKAFATAVQTGRSILSEAGSLLKPLTQGRLMPTSLKKPLSSCADCTRLPQMAPTSPPAMTLLNSGVTTDMRNSVPQQQAPTQNTPFTGDSTVSGDSNLETDSQAVYEHDNKLKQRAFQLLDSGQISDAKQMVSLCKNDFMKDSIREAIVEKQLESGHFDGALQTALEIKDENKQGFAMVDLTKAQLEIGAFNAAKSTQQHIKLDLYQGIASMHIEKAEDNRTPPSLVEEDISESEFW